MLDVVYNFVKNEIEEKGITSILLMKDEDGKVNVFSVLLLYSSALLIILTMFYVLKEARNELKTKNSICRDSIGEVIKKLENQRSEGFLKSRGCNSIRSNECWCGYCR